MMNQKKAKPKVTNLMHMINKMLYGVFILQFLIIAIFTAMSIMWMKKNAD
jgi:hypothetical protein